MVTRRRLLQVFGTVAAGTAVGAALFVPRPANAYYAGPVSDHFDGTEFFYPGAPKPKALGDLLRWQMLDPKAAWPVAVDVPRTDVPPRRMDGGGMRLSYVGHATFLLQTAGRNILFDPVWSERASPFSFVGPRRVTAPGIAFEALPPIDLVLVTHNHYDHLDIATLGRLWQRDRPRIVTPLGNDTIMRNAIPDLKAETVDWHQAVDFGGGLVVHAEPCQHWSARGLRDRRHALWAAFVIEGPAGRVLFIGDTGFGDGRTFRDIAARHPSLAMALLPIGAYEPRWFMSDQHMNPEEAVRAFHLLGAERAVGHHWGTFQLTAEGFEQPIADLTAALDRHGKGPAFLTPRPGEVIEQTG
jgi:L-ascorbate metabolism protein UlaG (beta-lactamase superfamily)